MGVGGWGVWFRERWGNLFGDLKTKRASNVRFFFVKYVSRPLFGCFAFRGGIWEEVDGWVASSWGGDRGEKENLVKGIENGHRLGRAGV